MVKRIGNIWTSIKSETARTIITLLITALFGAATAIVSGAWKMVKVPFDNRKDLEKVEVKNEEQDIILNGKLDKSEFIQYKEVQIQKEKNVDDKFESIDKKLDLIIKFVDDK